MTDEFQAALDRAVNAAGQPDEGWNSRFRAALEAEGIDMIETRWQADELDGEWIVAPLPLAGSDGWSKQTLLVWKGKP